MGQLTIREWTDIVSDVWVLERDAMREHNRAMLQSGGGQRGF